MTTSVEEGIVEAAIDDATDDGTGTCAPIAEAAANDDTGAALAAADDAGAATNDDAGAGA